jgi:methionine--tRNA ligase beta chain
MTNPSPEPRSTISFEEFAKIDLRVAKVLTCEPHPSADRLYKITLDDGSGTRRQVCAGIRPFYTPEQLIGRSVIIVANLAPRTIRGEVSNGMILAASDAPRNSAERRVVILTTLSEVAPGSIVS